MYERFISSSMFTGSLVAAMSVMAGGVGATAPKGPKGPQSATGPASAGGCSGVLPGGPQRGPSDVQVLHVERVVLDELAARLDLIAHQRREHQVGFGVVLGLDLQERPLRGIHRRL